MRLLDSDSVGIRVRDGDGLVLAGAYDDLSAWWKVIAWDVVDERLRDVMAGSSPL